MNLMMYKILSRNKTFKESPKSRGVFRNQASIYDGALLWIYSTTYYFAIKSLS